MEAMNDLFDENGDIIEEELCPDCLGYGFVVIEPNKQLLRYGCEDNIVVIRCYCESGKLDDVFDQIVLK